jgi:1,2-diacylglycerol 3-alpha-glucosyltransferase
MKVGIVYDCFPHYRAAVMRELLSSPQHDYVLVADEMPVDPTIKGWRVEDRARFIHAPCHRLISKFFFQKKVIGLALRRDFDAVIYMAYANFITTWLSALAARMTGKKVYFWTHGWNRTEAGLKAWLRRCFYRLADALLLYGHSAKMFGLTHGFAPEKLHVIYNSLDYELQKQIREEVTAEELQRFRQQLFEGPDRPMVVCSARLTTNCRFDLLLEAQAQLRDEGHDFNLLLIGDGPERAALQAQAERLKLSVHFYGACYDEAILARLIMAAHVTVSPGKVGLTAMHSLAYGTPVITHDDYEAQGPEWEAIVAGRTGDFFRRGDVKDLARAIRTWTQLPPDAARRAACYRLIDRFYNPSFQRRAIDRAVSCASADDLFWMKEGSSTALARPGASCPALAGSTDRNHDSCRWAASDGLAGILAVELLLSSGLGLGDPILFQQHQHTGHSRQALHHCTAPVCRTGAKVSSGETTLAIGSVGMARPSS